MARVELESVKKSFGPVEVLKDISFTIDDGRMAALLGPSGCGKSTTLFILTGLVQPTGGRVLFNGVDMAGVHPRKRNVGLVFQNYALYGHMTVRENIAFPLKLQGVSRAEAARRVAEVAEFTGLGELLDRKPSQLSGGQQQRVAAARAIVKRPKLLLMDEPLSNLDIELRARMRREIKRVQRETGITTVIVTHDQQEAMSLADRIFVMNEGRLQQAGDHRDLYARPANRFVAGFIGTPAMNFLGELSIAPDGGALWLASAGERVARLDDRSGLVSHRALGAAVLGVRPEHVEVVPDASRGVRARVSDVVPEGREQIVTLEIGATSLRSIVPATVDVRVDQSVGVEVAPRFGHLFAADSGEAIFHGEAWTR